MKYLSWEYRVILVLGLLLMAAGYKIVQQGKELAVSQSAPIASTNVSAVTSSLKTEAPRRITTDRVRLPNGEVHTSRVEDIGPVTVAVVSESEKKREETPRVPLGTPQRNRILGASTDLLDPLRTPRVHAGYSVGGVLDIIGGVPVNRFPPKEVQVQTLYRF